MPAVLITGASRGLGFEFAKQYAVEGWRVIACCRKPEDAIALKKLAPSARDMVSVVAMDVADNDTVRNAALSLKHVVIDILINSAGIAGSRSKAPARSTTRRGLGCSTSTRWVRCASLKRSLTTSPEVNADWW